MARVGDLVEVYPGDLSLLLRASALGEPWIVQVFPVGFPGERPFIHCEAADFVERAIGEGHFSAADAWSCWTGGAS